MRLGHIAWITGVSALATTLISVWVTYSVANAELEEILTEDLIMQSRMLTLSISSSELSPDFDQLLDAIFTEDEEDTLWVTVYDTASSYQISNLSHSLPLAQFGSHAITQQFDGYLWQGYQYQYENLVTQVLRRGDYAYDIRTDIAEDIVLPGLLASSVTLLLLLLLTNVTIRPLSRFARDLQQRSAGDLTPVTSNSRLQEINTVGDHLNQLLVGLADLLNRERQFTSDVAHELRTPLTTLKLELGLPQPDITALKQEVEHLIRVVEQLLTIARLEQLHWDKQFAPVSMSSLLHDERQRFLARFELSGMQLTVEADNSAAHGDLTLLQVMIDNLLHNCLHHCPEGTHVQLCWRSHVLSVTDNGPGIPDALMQSMTQRFASLDQKGEGLGLGLSITLKIAHLHGARFSLEKALPGLRVVIAFPS